MRPVSVDVGLQDLKVTLREYDRPGRLFYDDLFGPSVEFRALGVVERASRSGRQVVELVVPEEGRILTPIGADRA